MTEAYRVDIVSYMDTAVAVALIALVGTIGNAVFNYYSNVRSAIRREKRAADERWRREYTSLGAAADELAERINNILFGSYFEAYGGHPYGDEAVLSTLYRLCQYLGWSEVVRRSTRLPEPRHASEARAIQQLQKDVGKTLATDNEYGSTPMMIWREAQRALGEMMIVDDGSIIDTIGVTEFLATYDAFRQWLHRFERLLNASAESFLASSVLETPSSSDLLERYIRHLLTEDEAARLRSTDLAKRRHEARLRSWLSSDYDRLLDLRDRLTRLADVVRTREWQEVLVLDP